MVLLCACETDEVRAWSARRDELQSRLSELQRLVANEDNERVLAFRTALDLPAFIRDRKLAARVFVDSGAVRITVSGTVWDCRDTVDALAGLRWLTESWRLRLEAGRCDWEARTGPDFANLEQALTALPAKWTAPPEQWTSGGMRQLKVSVQQLETQVQHREAELGAAAVLGGKLAAVQPRVDSLKARPAPCDLAVIDRELALDEADRGKLLEVEHNRLIDPLEPRADARLRGLVEKHAGTLSWRCEAL